MTGAPQSEAARNEPEELFRLAFEYDPTGKALIGLGGRYEVVNRALCAITEYSKGQLLELSVADLTHPDDLAADVTAMRRLLSGELSRYTIEKRFFTASGTEMWVTKSASLIRRADGSPLQFIAQVEDISERRATQRAMEASQRHFAEVQRLSRIGSFELDVATGEMTWSLGLYLVLGLDPQTRPTAELFASMVHPDDGSALGRAWANATERGAPFDLTVRILRNDSRPHWVEVRVVVELAEDGTVAKLAGTLRDNTERMETDRHRRAAEARFEIGFEQAGIGAAILDLDGVPLRVNAAVCALLGRPKDLLVGHSWADYTHPDEVPIGEAMLERVSGGTGTYADERRYLRPDGAVVWASLHLALVRDESGSPNYYLAQLQDVSERKHMEEELVHLTLHDALTGLPNWALLSDRLVQGLAGIRRRGSEIGIIFLDVDHLKEVNDSMGRDAGNDLLRQVAARIAAVIRASDTVARFGGDEFVVVCDDASTQETQKIAERIIKAIRQRFMIEHQEMTVTASIGIAVANAKSTPESLLRDSDAAMYLAKARGRNRIELFDEVMRSTDERRLATGSALRRALERGELTVYYQPVVDIASGVMVSAEALVRWRHDDLGLINPGAFIPVAEETGLIIPIGAWVLEQACQELAKWQRIEPDIGVAVNLSVRQLVEPGIAEMVRDVLKRTGARPGSVCLELTESVFMDDVDYFGRTLGSLKDLGIQLAIDDFGTGYSSLSYLKRFPVDTLKIDQSFVSELDTDPHYSALVASIIAMADALGLGVTAEGVENHEQLAILRRLQCQRAQGFYLSRPIAAADMDDLLNESHRWPVD